MRRKARCWIKGLLACLLVLAGTAAAVQAANTPATPHAKTAAAAAPRGLSQYARPFVGTQGEGNTFPGAVAPFGMIQLSPDTDDQLWDTASGYEYSDSSIISFTLTHLSGTGILDLGDIGFMPQVGTPKWTPGSTARPDTGYRAPLRHDGEAAEPGYYRLNLGDRGVVELTATERAGMLRFRFPP